MSKKPGIYFSSDWHFSHGDAYRGILAFERGKEFKTIEEHDDFIYKTLCSWVKRWEPESEFWFLGDFGNPEWLFVFDKFIGKGISVHFVRGNHDSGISDKMLLEHNVEVHPYPVFLSHKMVVSHAPVGMWDDSLNIHGHLHSSVLNKVNYINANIHVCNYQPISMKTIAKHFSQMPAYNRIFMNEPYADMYKFIQEKSDCIYDMNGNIDLSASRLYQKLMREGKISVDNSLK